MPADVTPSRKTVTDFVSVWNTRDLTQLDAVVDPGYLQHHAGAAQGLEGLKAYFAEQFVKLPDLHVILEDSVCEDDKAVARISLHFTHDGTPMRGEIIDVWRLAGGKLTEHWSGDPVISGPAEGA